MSTVSGALPSFSTFLFSFDVLVKFKLPLWLTPHSKRTSFDTVGVHLAYDNACLCGFCDKAEHLMKTDHIFPTAHGTNFVSLLQLRLYRSSVDALSKEWCTSVPVVSAAGRGGAHG